MDFKVGDKVITKKGCRMNGPPGILEIVKIGEKWSTYDACVCKKPDGSKRLFLCKNLVIA